MSEEQKKILEQQLWNIANTLRGKMDADEFRDYILGFIFYKYLSEKMFIFANNELKEDGLIYNKLDENSEDGKQYLEAIKEASIESLGYFLKPSELFSEIAKKGNSDGDENQSNFILEELTKILKNIEQSTMGTASEDDFDNLFEDLDLTSTKLGRTEKDKNALISKVLGHLDKISFELENPKSDVLGDAYEYLIGQFASGAGKKAGEFYTPQQVSTVLAKLVTVGKTRLKSVYDPTCGSGSLLLRVKREVEDVSNFYGQELNRTTYNLARMNMILHGVHYQKFDIKQEDTLEHPQHINEKFEAIVANPPFSAHWSASPLFMTDDRFSQYGSLAPKTKADFAFVQHMIHHLADNGQMAIVLPHGVLFRGASEGRIRQYLIEEKNYLDAVIGLPANIFYGTSIPTCILVFKKCREHNENVLFIDASQGFEKRANQNYLKIEDIEKIVSTYKERSAQEKYSYLASLQEIKENDFNLNIPRYVDTFEEDEVIDLQGVANLLIETNELSLEINKKIKIFCKELNLPEPNGWNLSLLKQYKKSVMQKIFNQEIRFKNDDGSNYTDWEFKEFGEISNIKRGASPRPISDKKWFDNNSTIGWVRISDVTKSNKYLEKTEQYLSEEGVKKSRLIEKGNLIMSICATIGKPIYTNFTVCIHDGFVVFDSLTENKEFVYYYLELIRDNWYRYGQPGSQVNLNSDIVSSESINLPCLEEQQKIANFLTEIDNKINLVEK
jgi:type I restriction enzyme M protein